MTPTTDFIQQQAEEKERAASEMIKRRCPTCGHELAVCQHPYSDELMDGTCAICGLPKPAIQVCMETVVDSYDMWLGNRQGTGIRRLTEKIPVICIKGNGTAERSKPTTESQAQQPH